MDARPSSSIVERGGRFELEIDWVRGGECDYLAYVAFVRFDTGFDRGRFYSPGYGKIYRKILEKRKGRRFRFRVDHLPFNGIVTPEKWPVMRVIRDSVPVAVPRDIAPGQYVISVRMSESAHYPNYSFRDLLRDDDSFDGPDVARIVIR